MSDEILNINKPNRATALEVLMPDGGWWGEADGKFFCDEGLTLPTEEQIQAKLTELQTEYDSKQYQRDRAVAYPSITDVVVALAEKEEGDDTMWQEITTQRAKVKADIPKPT